MNGFFNIKNESCINYLAFNKIRVPSNDYDVDLSNRNRCSLRLGNAKFIILPVATACEAQQSVRVFGQAHPTGFAFNQLDGAIRALGLPTDYNAPNVQDNGVTPCFKFGFKISALVCRQVGGVTFLSVCPTPTTWVWLIILRGSNLEANQMLENFNEMKNTITVEDALQCYNEMNF